MFGLFLVTIIILLFFLYIEHIDTSIVFVLSIDVVHLCLNFKYIVFRFSQCRIFKNCGKTMKNGNVCDTIVFNMDNGI